MPEEPVLSKKDAMLAEILTDLPDGIRSFLETVIPQLTATTAPTDVDSAIITQGILAHNLNIIFKTFEGLTPAAIPLYIGQLNTVTHNIMIASLEIADVLNSESGFEIVNPRSGQVYLPGDVRFQVRPTHGKLQQVAVEIDGENPIPLEWDSDGFFWGFARLEDANTYTANASALFVDDKGEETIKTGSVTFFIDPDAEELPEEKDFGPIEYAYDGWRKARDAAITAVEQELESVPLVNTAVAFARKMLLAVDKITGNSVSAVQTIIDALATANSSRAISPEDQHVITLIQNLDTELSTVYSAATQEYFKNNPHPPYGFTSSPTELKGAAAAMNEKYGPGSVYYEGM